MATSPVEVTSSAWVEMDWADFKRYGRHGISGFVFREVREETTISKSELFDVRVKAVIREFRRIGQPMLILTGKTRLSYRMILHRIEISRKYAQNPWLYPYWYIWSLLLRKSGREFWEMDSMIGVKKNELLRFIHDPIPPTRAAILKISKELNKSNQNI
ncbi:hypothetical protein [Picrophilus oshimae]|uniref:Uncharacterized protein n=1 Tax=Picrophilus torridus (strain ATCC 700027 / DSM 9790 / JCM 10055 / NBRC 100828 / KAW 2/3) TaxID=1122961 RepID=A0A8G2L7T6_PICTO|nr:hypothetical protein [Picrophilus oshimae]SMD31453.1 hypothetical protein SAMN02745355_1394 [Picrophilus oshimae DSM 9789]